MLELIRLIFKNAALILFILLESISIFLVIQFNERQNRIFNTSSTYIIGYFTQKAEGIFAYFDLAEENRRLIAENSLLRNSNSGQETEVDECHFDYIPARIISNSIIFNDNYILINKGRKDGIRNHSGIIDLEGIVGIIVEISDHFSMAISLLHRQTRISATIGNTGYFGTLLWDGINSRRMLLEDVPSHATVQIGDTIYTSGFSILFPAGLVIGVVEDINELGKDVYFQEIGIRLINDLGKLKHVYVLENHEREEIEQLQRNSR
jgi:rod shape-determining protein MreC